MKIISFSPVLNSINNYCVSAGNSRISDALLNLNTNYREQQRIYKRDVEALIEEIENEGTLSYLQICQKSICTFFGIISIHE